jgi:hypothetical protein
MTYVTGTQQTQAQRDVDFTAALLQMALSQHKVEAIVTPLFDGPQVETYHVPRRPRRRAAAGRGAQAEAGAQDPADQAAAGPSLPHPTPRSLGCRIGRVDGVV